jgi:hypothetical protein
MNFALRFALAAVAALSLTACESAVTKPNGIAKVVSTTSFGMCAGYCKTTLTITEKEAVLVREAWGRGAGANLPTQRHATPLGAQEWADIAAAATSAKIDGLPDVIGCPDCADGGAETLTVVGEGRNKTVKFDHGAALPEAQALLDRVRALRTRLMPKEE